MREKSMKNVSFWPDFIDRTLSSFMGFCVINRVSHAFMNGSFLCPLNAIFIICFDLFSYGTVSSHFCVFCVLCILPFKEKNWNKCESENTKQWQNDFISYCNKRSGKKHAKWWIVWSTLFTWNYLIFWFVTKLNWRSK